MLVIKAQIFEQFPEISFGFNTKTGLDRKEPFFFNVSLSVGDDKKNVEENRAGFFQSLGLSENNVALQKQVHGDVIRYVKKGGLSGESDAMITDKKGIGLAVSTADCTPIFIYDRKNKTIAGIHSGWRSTEQKIVQKTLEKLVNDFKSRAEDLFVYMGPSISQINYEVGEDVAIKFDQKYLVKKGDKFLLNVAQNNYDMLIDFGIPISNIQKSNLCTYEVQDLIHSYRRHGM